MMRVSASSIRENSMPLNSGIWISRKSSSTGWALNTGKCLEGTAELTRQAEERSLVYITFQQTDSQWLVIDDCTR